MTRQWKPQNCLRNAVKQVNSVFKLRFSLMGKLYGRLSLVSSLTLFSRFLGLARDMLFFSCFGASLIGEAFILAFTFPNLFRRMLGEGTLSSAFIPVFTDTLKKKSEQLALNLLSEVTSRLFLFLGIFTVLVCLLSYFASAGSWFSQEKWEVGLHLNSLSFTYIVLICSSAILVGALNSKGRFFAGAFSPVLLNLCMICSMVIGRFVLGLEIMVMAVILCGSVVFAGILQLALPWIQLKKTMNWKWHFTMSSSPEIDAIRSLFWVGALGAAVGQINILISRFLAYSLDESGGLSYLFLSSRLVELPLGVFAIAISTVFFPKMSKESSSDNKDAFWESVFTGLRMTAGITIPAAIGLGFLAVPILSALFQWGEFGSSEVQKAKGILSIACIGLPFYAISSFLVKVYHSRKNMTFPLHAAAISMLCNLVFSVVLMQEYQVHGLAWANVLAAVLQTTYLIVRLDGIRLKEVFSNKPFCSYSIVVASVFMSGILWLLKYLELFSSSKQDSFIFLILAVPLGAGAYGFCLYLCGFPELKSLVGKIKSNRSVN